MYLFIWIYLNNVDGSEVGERKEWTVLLCCPANKCSSLAGNMLVLAVCDSIGLWCAGSVTLRRHPTHPPNVMLSPILQMTSPCCQPTRYARILFKFYLMQTLGICRDIYFLPTFTPRRCSFSCSSIRDWSTSQIEGNLQQQLRPLLTQLR